jgi:hypothetical protein
MEAQVAEGPDESARTRLEGYSVGTDAIIEETAEGDMRE